MNATPFQKPIDWEAVFRELERGRNVTDIAALFDLSIGSFMKRVRSTRPYRELTPEQVARFDELHHRNRTARRFVAKTVPIDWALVFRQLRAGHRAGEIAQWTVGISLSRLSMRVKKELPPAAQAEYHHLARINSRRRSAGCGTYGGLQKHWREKTLACAACLAVDRQRSAKVRQRRKERAREEDSVRTA